MVTAATGGVIIFSGTNIMEGQRVTPGQVLFTISGTGLADNNSALRYSETINNYEKAKADYERQSLLAKDKIVSEKELLVTEKEYKNAAAAYELLSKNFNISGQKVSCPIAGYVKELYVMNGEFVETGRPLMTVAANRSLILKSGVSQKYATVLDDIYSANIRIAETGMTYTLEELHGRVISRGHSTDADNYLVPVVLQIDNVSGFITGGFAEVFLKTVTNTEALTVPNSALLEEQGNFFIMVQVTPELFEKREVKVGATDGLKSEITSGLDITERVVTRGAVLVKLSQASGTLDPHAGHVH
jgi:RND family efflux transporter MFP subunit